MKISDFQTGQVLHEIRLVLASADVRKTKSARPKNFVNLKLKDAESDIDCKIWDWPTEEHSFEAGKVYKVDGTVGEYLGKKQLTITTLTLDADQRLTEFLPKCNYNTDYIEELVSELCSSIKDPILSNILSAVLQDMHTELHESTSAINNHHVGIGGNWLHSAETALLAKNLADTFITLNQARQAAAPINRDLVIVGAFLHDLGKPDTYQMEGPVITYTTAGQLFDHIYLGTKRFNRIIDHIVQHLDEKGDAKQANKVRRAAMFLEHIILSHHGIKEYGSPVTPAFLEAIIISKADGLSATFDALYAANKQPSATNSLFTDRIYSLDNRQYMLQKTIKI